MFEGVTSCPACGALFRVTEKHLLLAEGSVRCGVCRNFFQAEDHFVSPMLDATELIAIKQEYWSDFDSYLFTFNVARDFLWQGKYSINLSKGTY